MIFIIMRFQIKVNGYTFEVIWHIRNKIFYIIYVVIDSFFYAICLSNIKVVMLNGRPKAAGRAAPNSAGPHRIRPAAASRPKLISKTL